MKVACWNINSVRVRLERLLGMLRRHEPDVLCLQEIKVETAQFPGAELEALGYHVAVFGQKTYNGVAILSRTPVTDVVCGLRDEVDDAQARLLAASVGPLRVLNAYVPNGSHMGSDKAQYKLTWLERLRRYLQKNHSAREPLILCGDFNIAPRACDVAQPQAWEETVLFHPQMRQALAELTAWGLIDVFAEHHPQGGVYSWWDYRLLGFPKNNGLRIDHVLATAATAARCTAVQIDRDERKGKQPSDHAPVIADFAD